MRKLGSDGLKVHLLTITKFEHTQILTVVFGRHALYLINVSIVIASSTVPGVPHQVLIWEHNICRWISLVLTPCRRFLPKEQFQKRVGSAVISSITTTGKLLTPSLISKGKSRCLAWKIIYVISWSQSLTPAFFLIQEKPLFFFVQSKMEELSWYKCNFTPGNIYRYDAGDFISFPSLSNKANHSLLMVNYLRYFLLERDSKLVEKKPFIYKLDRRFSIAPSWRCFSGV